ncbi:hypothetical protein GCM10009789_03060 [Kribbella sancticallisti]|uniref:Pvc16 N-terminal domain-containing protein n=1 Tax=Kribbella sancticallisti TaxID=460087 RepID=A0ABN2C4Z9_9ACTN
MGALFSGLHDVAQVMTEHIREETGIQDVQAGAPREVSATTEPGARITLLYTTPQPGHRNDPAEAGAGGDRRPPPLSLSCFYLVTTSGADADDPVAAHHALGQIMTLYHDVQSLQLPLSTNPGSPPGVFTDLGLGELTVTQVPVTLDQIDKVWTPITQQLQPWALFEVAPVQLVSRRPDAPAAPQVRPGGLTIDEPVGQRPMLVRITPQPARPSGRIRLDVITDAALDAVWAAGLHIPAGDPALTLGPAGDRGTTAAVLDLSRGGLSVLQVGMQPFTVAASGLTSRTATAQLIADTPTLDAPPDPVHDPATDLVLTGAELGAVQEIVAWPDRGVATPTEVHSLPFTPGGAGAVTVRSDAGLALLPVPIRTWRLAARLTGQSYTPYVVLELSR